MSKVVLFLRGSGARQALRARKRGIYPDGQFAQLRGHWAFMDVLEALLWGFHNSRSGACFPSYETIAEKAGCARSTVAEALKALEWAGVLTWQNRITRIRERCRDLFGQDGWRWRVIRISNAYVFRGPKASNPSKSENPTGTLDQDTSSLPSYAARAARKQKAADKMEPAGLAAMLEAAKGLPDLLAARLAAWHVGQVRPAK